MAVVATLCSFDSQVATTYAAPVNTLPTAYEVQMNFNDSDGAAVKWTTIRNYPRALFIGSAKTGSILSATYDRKAKRTGYVFGSLTGGYKGICGWIVRKNIHRVDGYPAATTCTHKASDKSQTGIPQIPAKKFATVINCDGCDTGTPIILQRDSPVYRNIDLLHPKNKRGYDRDLDLKNGPKDVLKAGEIVRWRYITHNGWVAISSDLSTNYRLGRMAWGFVRIENIDQGQICSTKLPLPNRWHPDWPPVCSLHSNNYQSNHPITMQPDSEASKATQRAALDF